MNENKSQTAETPTEDPRTDQDYAAEWEQVSEKVLLAQIYAELQQIRVALTSAQDDSESDDGKEMYRCQRCDGTVPADAREQHARETHKAPPGMVDGMFERAD